MEKFFNDAGIFRLGYLKNKPKNNYEFYFFRKGEAKYIGVIGMGMHAQKRENSPVLSEKPDNTTLKLVEKAHVYNVRTKEYMGYTDIVPVSLKLDHPEFFALLPYKVEKFDVSSKYEADNHSIVYSGKVNEKDANERLIMVNVFEPDGILSVPYSHKIWTVKGAFYNVFPLALNDKSGKWKLELTDVISGFKVQNIVEVGRRNNK